VTHALPPFIERRLGPARAAQAVALRKRLADAGVALPPWIDARPGRLRLVVGDLADDPPLSRTAVALAEGHGDWLLTGLGALQLAAAAPTAALHAPPGPALTALRRAAAGTRVAVYEALPAWPSRPELDLPGAFGRAWVCPPALLDRAAAAVSGAAPRRLCTVAGEVRVPAVLAREDSEPPRSLIRRAGGAAAPDWVAIAGGAPGGRLWEPDAPLPEEVALLLVLPASLLGTGLFVWWRRSRL